MHLIQLGCLHWGMSEVPTGRSCASCALFGHIHAGNGVAEAFPGERPKGKDQLGMLNSHSPMCTRAVVTFEGAMSKFRQHGDSSEILQETTRDRTDCRHWKQYMRGFHPKLALEMSMFEELSERLEKNRREWEVTMSENMERDRKAFFTELNENNKAWATTRDKDNRDWLERQNRGLNAMTWRVAIAGIAVAILVATPDSALFEFALWVYGLFS